MRYSGALLPLTFASGDVYKCVKVSSIFSDAPIGMDVTNSPQIFSPVSPTFSVLSTDIEERSQPVVIHSDTSEDCISSCIHFPGCHAFAFHSENPKFCQLSIGSGISDEPSTPNIDFWLAGTGHRLSEIEVDFFNRGLVTGNHLGSAPCGDANNGAYREFEFQFAAFLDVDTGYYGNLNGVISSLKDSETEQDYELEQWYLSKLVVDERVTYTSHFGSVTADGERLSISKSWFTRQASIETEDSSISLEQFLQAMEADFLMTIDSVKSKLRAQGLYVLSVDQSQPNGGEIKNGRKISSFNLNFAEEASDLVELTCSFGFDTSAEFDPTGERGFLAGSGKYEDGKICDPVPGEPGEKPSKNRYRRSSSYKQKFKNTGASSGISFKQWKKQSKKQNNNYGGSNYNNEPTTTRGTTTTTKRPTTPKTTKEPYYSNDNSPYAPGEWGEWGKCCAKYGEGRKARSRACFYHGNFATMKTSDKYCQPKIMVEEMVCYGKEQPSYATKPTQAPYEKPSSQSKWMNWEQWSSCSASCGKGYQVRTRRCKFNNLYQKCVGESSDTRKCRADNDCDSYENKEDYETNSAYGEYSEYQWSDWAPWTECTASCDGGLMYRSRQCTDSYGNIFAHKCPGQKKQQKACNRKACPYETTMIPTTIYEPSSWAQWTEWTECTKSCGGGLSYRKRSCLTTSTSKQCYGQSKQKRVCNRASCEVYTTQEPTTTSTIGYGRWTKWTAWSQCSTSCGRGMRERTRKCKKNNKYDRDCVGRKTDREACNQHTWCSTTSTTTTTTTAPAPFWSSWSKWSSCSKTCGYGTKTRKRTCIDSYFTGQSCYGKKLQSRYCNAFPCTTTYASTTTERPSEWSNWSTWTSCSRTCNVGTRSRSRYCKGAFCAGAKNQQQKCGWKMCPTYPPETTTTEDPNMPPDNPKYSSWSDWSTCSRSCGGGGQYRTRKCKAGFCVGVLRQNKTCNRAACTTTSTTTTTTTTTTTAQDSWGSWGPWGECRQTAYGGRKYRERECSGYSNRCSGKQKESKKCTIITTTTSTTTTTTLPSSRWGEWSSWSSCSKSCEGGISERTRKCVGQYKNCNGQDRQTKVCNRKSCPTTPPPTTTEDPDCESHWLKWGEWGACSKTCGYGRTIRSRECKPDCYGSRNCPGSKNQKKSCMLVESCLTTTTSTTSTTTTTTTIRKPCVGEWSDWSEWGSCSATCDGGIMEKTRVCEDKGSYSGSWDYRKRRSIHEDFPHGPHGPGDSGNNNNNGNSNSGNNNNDGHNGSGSNNNSDNNSDNNSNNNNSGGGQNSSENNQSISSECKCKGSAVSKKKCNKEKCSDIYNPNNHPAWGQWGEWRECSVTCGAGKQTRIRECLEYNKTADPSKCGDEDQYFETKSCDAGKCSGGGYDMFGWTKWSEWSKCSKSCDGGLKSRTRTCKTYNCPGKNEEKVKCNAHDCEDENDSETGWANWTEWGACTSTCGKGYRERRRECTNEYSTCPGKPHEREECKVKECAVNGGYGYDADKNDETCPWRDNSQPDCKSGHCSMRFASPCLQKLFKKHYIDICEWQEASGLMNLIVEFLKPLGIMSEQVYGKCEHGFMRSTTSEAIFSIDWTYDEETAEIVYLGKCFIFLNHDSCK